MIKRMTDERFGVWVATDEAGELTWGEDKPNSVAELWFALAAEREHVAELETGYAEAIEDISDWAGYASPYFQHKNDLDGTIAAHKAILKQEKSGE